MKVRWQLVEQLLPLTLGGRVVLNSGGTGFVCTVATYSPGPDHSDRMGGHQTRQQKG